MENPIPDGSPGEPEVSSDNAAPQSVKVAVNIRPLIHSEIINGSKDTLTVFPEYQQVWISEEKAFTFDHVYGGQGAPMSSLFDDCVLPLIDGFFQGYNATVLAYGQTGSGKTYTMGTGYTDGGKLEAGVVPRVMKTLFERIESLSHKIDFSLRVSFIEIHKEEIRDLLDNGQESSTSNGSQFWSTPVARRLSGSPHSSPQGAEKSPITIRELSNGVSVVGAIEAEVDSLEDTIGCLKHGLSFRSTGSHQMNARSSRSHAIFTITMEQRGKVQSSSLPGYFSPDMQEHLFSKIHLVDLAGSERVKRTKTEGNRLKEGIHINKGLLALGNVISALGDDRKKKAFANRMDIHVPYRDSKLTRLLQDSLGGNSRTVMIACVSPADTNLDETVNTLKYANRARNIKNKPMVNRLGDGAELELRQLRQQLLALQAEVDKAKIFPGGSEPERAVAVKSDVEEAVLLRKRIAFLEASNGKYRESLEEARDSLLQSEEKRIKLQSELNSSAGDLAAAMDSLAAVKERVGRRDAEIARLKAELDSVRSEREADTTSQERTAAEIALQVKRAEDAEIEAKLEREKRMLMEMDLKLARKDYERMRDSFRAAEQKRKDSEEREEALESKRRLDEKAHFTAREGLIEARAELVMVRRRAQSLSQRSAEAEAENRILRQSLTEAEVEKRSLRQNVTAEIEKRAELEIRLAELAKGTEKVEALAEARKEAEVVRQSLAVETEGLRRDLAAETEKRVELEQRLQEAEIRTEKLQAMAAAENEAEIIRQSLASEAEALHKELLAERQQKLELEGRLQESEKQVHMLQALVAAEQESGASRQRLETEAEARRQRLEAEAEAHRQRLEAEVEALHQSVASESERRAELQWRLEEAEKTIHTLQALAGRPPTDQSVSPHVRLLLAERDLEDTLSLESFRSLEEEEEDRAAVGRPSALAPVSSDSPVLQDRKRLTLVDQLRHSSESMEEEVKVSKGREQAEPSQADGNDDRRKFLELKRAAIVIQRRWRAHNSAHSLRPPARARNISGTFTFIPPGNDMVSEKPDDSEPWLMMHAHPGLDVDEILEPEGPHAEADRVPRATVAAAVVPGPSGTETVSSEVKEDAAAGNRGAGVRVGESSLTLSTLSVLLSSRSGELKPLLGGNTTGAAAGEATPKSLKSSSSSRSVLSLLRGRKSQDASLKLVLSDVIREEAAEEGSAVPESPPIAVPLRKSLDLGTEKASGKVSPRSFPGPQSPGRSEQQPSPGSSPRAASPRSSSRARQVSFRRSTSLFEGSEGLKVGGRNPRVWGSEALGLHGSDPKEATVGVGVLTPEGRSALAREKVAWEPYVFNRPAAKLKRQNTAEKEAAAKEV